MSSVKKKRSELGVDANGKSFRLESTSVGRFDDDGEESIKSLMQLNVTSWSRSYLYADEKGS